MNVNYNNGYRIRLNYTSYRFWSKEPKNRTEFMEGLFVPKPPWLSDEVAKDHRDCSGSGKLEKIPPMNCVYMTVPWLQAIQD